MQRWCGSHLSAWVDFSGGCCCDKMVLYYVMLRAMLVTLAVTHNLHWKERFASSFSFFLLPYLCVHTVGLDRMEVVWVCFDVLLFFFGISLFVCIDFYFILAFLYIFVLLVFSFKCLFQCLFVCLFISFVFPFSIYLLFMLCDYFIIFSL